MSGIAHKTAPYDQSKPRGAYVCERAREQATPDLDRAAEGRAAVVDVTAERGDLRVRGDACECCERNGDRCPTGETCVCVCARARACVAFACVRVQGNGTQPRVRAMPGV